MIEPSPHRLSEDLQALLAKAEGRSLSIGEIEALLQGRGFALIIMLLAAPFLIPSVPGLSTPFGAAISLMGGCRSLCSGGSCRLKCSAKSSLS